MTRKPLPDKIKRIRQRQRRDRSWRVWWEPETAVRALGFEVVELDPNRPTWSVGQANLLNKQVDRAHAEGGRVAERGARSMAALVNLYLHSRDFKRTSDKTQHDYRAKLKLIDAKWGDRMVTEFTKPVMHQWYETLYENNGKYQAIAIMRIMSLLFSFSELKGWRPENSNPCFRLKMEIPKGRNRTANWLEYDALISAADRLERPDLACAIGLSALCGARQTDILKARIDGFKQIGPMLTWEFVRSKRGNHGILKVHSEVSTRVLNLIRMAGPDQQLLLLHPTTGKGYTIDSFANQWANVRAAAAVAAPSVKTLQFRDLRRTFGVWSRAGGASKEDVGDVLGNSAGTDPQLGETYMPAQFATAARAVDAIARPVAKTSKAG